jgi:hypothetical protein
MADLAPMDKYAIRQNALSVARSFYPDEMQEIVKADDVIKDAKKIEAYLLEVFPAPEAPPTTKAN